LRTDKYKFILSRKQDYQRRPLRELYDLEADPEELNNIAEDYPEVVKELEEILEGWIREMMRKNGWKEDPLIANGLTMAADWEEWVNKHGYW